MSQHDYDVANAAGAAFRSDMNLALVAGVSRNSGASAPATTFAYMPWADIAAGVMKYRDGANANWLFGVPLATPMAGMGLGIYGNTYSNNGSDPTNDIDIAAGGCADGTNVYWMVGAALTKQLDAAWAVGTNQGGLDTGSIGNSDYYIWRIARPDTGVVDVLFSLSSTAPTMPANYTYKRLIGWFKRVAATIVTFNTYEIEGGGLELTWKSPTLDISLTNTLTTSRRTDAVKVPLNFSVVAHLNARLGDVSSGSAFIHCPDMTDVAIDGVSAPLTNMLNVAGGNAEHQLWVRTSAAGLIAARCSLATADTYSVSTIGFKWSRRN